MNGWRTLSVSRPYKPHVLSKPIILYCRVTIPFKNSLIYPKISQNTNSALLYLSPSFRVKNYVSGYDYNLPYK
jgi:hypothetical protein